MIDEVAFRKDAYHLGYLFVDLEQAKTSRRPPPEARVMAPGFGPGDPLNVNTFSDGEEITEGLRAWCETMRDYIEPDYRFEPDVIGNLPDAIELARWCAHRSFYIAEHPEGEALHEDIRRWCRQLEKIVGHGPDIANVANADPYLTADSIQRSLTAKGLACPPATIRSWAQRGHVATKRRRDGHTAYRLGDIIGRLTSDN